MERFPHAIHAFLPGMAKRYVLTALGSVGFFCVYALRVNLNVALVAMVRKPLSQDITSHGDTQVACLELVKFPGYNATSAHTEPTPVSVYQ